MKNNFHLILSVIYVTLIGVGCTKIPEPCFKFDNTITYNQGDTVTFENCSIDGSSYMWYFGDGSTSTEANPKHVFESPGHFTLILIVTSANGKKSTGIGQGIDISLKPPKKMWINKVILSSFSTSYYNPDIYMVFSEDSTIILDKNEIHYDCKPENEYTFTKGFPLEFHEVNGEFDKIRVDFNNDKKPIANSLIGYSIIDLMSLFESSFSPEVDDYKIIRGPNVQFKVYFEYEY